MVERIKLLLERKQFTASAFADKLGIPRSRISHVLSGRNNPSLELVNKILDTFPEINTEWLVRGKGDMLRGASIHPSQDLFSEYDKGDDVTGGKTRKSTSASQEIIDFDTPSSENHASEKNMSTPPAPSDRAQTNQHQASSYNQRDNELRDEDIPDYQRKSSIIKIITLYDDGTFAVYLPR